MANEFKVKNGIITPTLQSTVATGTSPLTVASTTLVSNLNADLLDGNHASAFATAAHTHTWDNITSKPLQLLTESVSTASLAVGWYTIATNIGDRASAKFIIADTTSGLHQTVHFYASHHFGSGNNITIVHNDWYGGGGPVRYIRIKEGGTYDGALLQIYIDSASAGLSVYMYEDVQSSGFTIKNFVADGTDPGSVANFAALTNIAAQVDLDVASMIVSDEIYIGGATTQYKALHAGNYTSYSPTLTGTGASGTWAISITGNAATTTTLQTARNIGDASFNGSVDIVPQRITYKDTRSTNFNPYGYIGVTLHLKQNSVDGLADGGTYHGTLNLEHWSDPSGGNSHQLAFTDNNNIWLRQSTSSTTWGSWNKILHDGNYNNYALPLTGGTVSGNLTITGNADIGGNVQAADFNSTSDARYKIDIQTVTSALDKVSKLRGVSFNWKDSGKPAIGVIAQEVEQVIPEVVHTSENRKTVSYGNLVGVLIEAIKEQQQQIQELQRQLAKLL